MKPELPTPVALEELLTFTNSTWDPTERSWGSSVFTVTSNPFCVTLEINLKFLCWFSFVNEPDPKYVWISPSVEPIEVFDSWTMNPSLGGLATAPPNEDGITYLAR